MHAGLNRRQMRKRCEAMAENRTSTRSWPRCAGRRWISVALVIVVLLSGGAASFVLMASVDRTQQRFAGRLMDQNADSIGVAVDDEADRYDETLTDLAASVGAQSNFTSDDFNSVTSRLNRQRLPGVSGVAFVVPATRDEIPVVQAGWRDRGATGLRLVPVGGRFEHMFVVFSRTLDNTVPVPGRDLSQAAEPLEALHLARSSGRVAASRTYVLLKDRELPAVERQLSFMLTAPVYGSVGTPDEGRFRGWMLMGMRGGDFIDEVLETHARDAMRIALYDLSGAAPTSVAATANRARPGAVALERARTITVGQRTWQLRIQPTDLLLNATDRNLPELSGGVGLLLTVLMGLLVNARRRALSKVDRTTAELRLDIEQRKAAEMRCGRASMSCGT
jgi:CHASE1-domain containing sensor protein